MYNEQAELSHKLANSLCIDKRVNNLVLSVRKIPVTIIQFSV